MTFRLSFNARYNEWDVLTADDGAWIASFREKTDAETFIKIKQISAILSA